MMKAIEVHVSYIDRKATSSAAKSHSCKITQLQNHTAAKSHSCKMKGCEQQRNFHLPVAQTFYHCSFDACLPPNSLPMLTNIPASTIIITVDHLAGHQSQSPQTKDTPTILAQRSFDAP